MVLALPDRDARYRLLEPVRQYAAARLAQSGEADVVADRHTGWVIALGHDARDALRTRDQGPWLDLLDAEHANLRSALERLITARTARRGGPPARRYLAGLGVAGYAAEGLDWTERIRAQAASTGIDDPGLGVPARDGRVPVRDG